MKAAVLFEVNKPLVIEDVSVPNPGPREVLIRTRVAGLCHSDLHFMEGLYPHPLPAVLGHESAGVVEKVGSDVTYVKPGDHVVTCLSVFCGTCDNCTTGPHGALHRHHREDAARPVQPAVLGALGETQPVPQPVVVRRADAGARKRHRQNPQGHAAGTGGADRLRRHHRLWRCGEHGEGQGRRNRRGDRLRRRRHGRDQWRRDRRRRPHHRDRHQSGQTAACHQAWRHRHRRSRATATWCSRCANSRVAACITPSRCWDARKPRNSRSRCWRPAAPRRSSA